MLKVASSQAVEMDEAPKTEWNEYSIVTETAD